LFPSQLVGLWCFYHDRSQQYIFQRRRKFPSQLVGLSGDMVYVTMMDNPVSIPTRGIVVFLRGVKRSRTRTRPGTWFPSQLVGLWCFYFVMQLDVDSTEYVSIPTRGIVVFLLVMLMSGGQGEGIRNGQVFPSQLVGLWCFYLGNHCHRRQCDSMFPSQLVGLWCFYPPPPPRRGSTCSQRFHPNSWDCGVSTFHLHLWFSCHHSVKFPSQLVGLWCFYVKKYEKERIPESECFHPNSWDCGVSTYRWIDGRLEPRENGRFPSQLVGLWCFYTKRSVQTCLDQLNC